MILTTDALHDMPRPGAFDIKLTTVVINKLARLSLGAIFTLVSKAVAYPCWPHPKGRFLALPANIILLTWANIKLNCKICYSETH